MLSLQDTNSLIWLQGVQFSFYPINLQYFRTKYTERGPPSPPKKNKDIRQTYNSRLKIYKNSSWNMFPGSGLREERIEGVVSGSDSLIRGHLSIRLDSFKKHKKKRYLIVETLQTRQY